MVERQGIPIAIRLSGVNVHDSVMFEETFVGVQRVLEKAGNQESDRKKGGESKERLGRHRWVAERTLSASGASRFATKDVRISIGPSLISVAHSSVGASSNGSVRRSKL